MTSELTRLVERAVATLPDNQRLVLTLKDVEGLESDEVCRLAGISAANLRVLLHRGRQRVRQMVEDVFLKDAHLMSA